MGWSTSNKIESFTYKELREFLGNKERKFIKKTPAQTWVENRGDHLGVFLYETEILSYYEDGRIVLNSGGRKTPTTKQRLSDYLPRGYFIYQKRSVWYLRRPDNTTPAPFNDGMIVYPDGTIVNTGPSVKETHDLVKRINKYAGDYIRALATGDVPAPGPGDCWHCYLYFEEDNKTWGELGDGDHLLSHMEEDYFVPSLLLRAVQTTGRCSLAAESWLHYSWYDKKNVPGYFTDIATVQLKKALVKYLKKQLGVA